MLFQKSLAASKGKCLNGSAKGADEEEWTSACF